MAKKILSIALALIMALSVFAVAASAATLTAGANDLAEVVASANDGDTVALTEDITVDSYYSVTGDGVTIDLAGYDFTSTGGTGLDLYGDITIIDSVGGGTVSAVNNAVWVNPGATVTIEDGIYDGAIRVDSESGNNVATAVIEDGTFNGDIDVFFGGVATINGGSFAGKAYTYDSAVLTINDGTFVNGDYCIVGNGNDTVGSTVVVNGGSFTATSVEGAAIYQPQAGTLTINGGTFTGADAIYQKCGNITINGGSFYAKGSKAAFRHDGSGFNPTGDTIVVEPCGYPSGDPSLTINGGAFYSKYNEIIGYYVYGDNDLDSTGFVVNGAFAKEVPAQFWANPNAFTLFNVTGGTATIDGNTVTILADVGSEKIEVSRLATNGKIVTFSEYAGGAKLSRQNQLYARTPGTAVATIDGVDYNIVIAFQSFDVEDLLVVTNATMAVEGSTITLTPIADGQITVSKRTTADTTVTFSGLTGYAKVASGGSLYAKNYGTAQVTVPNAGTFTVVFDLANVPFADTLRTTNATVAVSGNTITLTPVDTTKSVSIVNKILWTGETITFSNLSKYGKISSNGSFYSDKYATATATVGGTDYTVVIAFAQVPVADLLQATNATVAVEGTTITLTPVDNTATASLNKWLTDGTLVTFTAGAGSKISKGGALYAKEPAVGTATFDGVTYDVVFDFTPIIPTIDELLTIKGATMSVSGTTITLTATSTQINVYPTLTDGSKATFSNLSGGAKTAKAGTLYAKYAGSATVTVAGVDYTVNFVF